MNQIPLGMLARRDLLRIGGYGMLGLTMPRMLRAAETAPVSISKWAPRAKSVIFLYQFGGPSHVDTFDMKPQAPDGIRSAYKSIDTRVPGLQICHHLPEVAKVMDKVTLLRTVHHNMKNHNSAAYYALTGHAPPLDDIRLRDTLELFPAYGSVVDSLSPSTNGMPSFVAYPHTIRDGEVTPGQHASFLGKSHDPLLITQDPNDSGFRLPELSLPANVTSDRLNNRRALQHLINQQIQMQEYSAAAKGLDAYYARALGMLTSPKIRQAFDLSQEPAALRDQYGRTTYGQSCLLARRLVEHGVKFINVYFADSIGGRSKTSGGWDTHGFDNTRMYPILDAYQLPITNRTLPTLLTDLDQRGLLDETLVVWMGEFGRTPRLNANISRDHWPQCYSVLLAGGGVKRGFVYGKSDKTGAFPDQDPVRLEDLTATMFALMGLDPTTEVHDVLNRPLPLSSGRVVEEIFA